MKGLPIDVAYCNKCNLDFLYIIGKVNSLLNRNSDYYGIPKCPECGSWRDTIRVGKFKVQVWSVQKEP